MSDQQPQWPQQPEDEPMRTRSGPPPRPPQQAPYQYQAPSQAPHQAPYQAQYQAPNQAPYQAPYQAPQQPGYAPYQAAQPPKRKHTGRNVVLGIVGAIVLIIVISAVATGGKNSSGTPAAGAAATATTVSATDTTAAAAAPATTDAVSTAATDDAVQAVPTAATAQVTYKCTGSAPDGIDITYGPDGSDYSASHLPFSKTMSLDGSAEYYVVTAQLSGSGNVSCTTTVQTSDGTRTVKSAAATGGYNIASAEVCSDFDGGFDAC